MNITRRQNGVPSLSYFTRTYRPLFADVAGPPAGCAQRRPSRPPRLIRETSDSDELLTLSGRAEMLDQQFQRTLQRVERMMKCNDARAAERDRQASVRAEWQLVATVVDRILLVLFVSTTVGFTMVVLFSAPNAFDFMFGTGPADASLLQASGSTSHSNQST